MSKLFLWVEKYRPKTVSDCILTDVNRAVFQGYVDNGEIPNLLLPGTAGIGKTTLAKALCEEMGADYYLINGSDEGRYLDTVRTKCKSFASSSSLVGGKHKVVIIDEADNSTPDVQLLLRAVIEEFQNNCRFIFTCNYINKIIDPIKSRCSVVDMSTKGKNRAILASNFHKRCMEILTKENIEYDAKVLAEVVGKYFPDFRRTLNELQAYSSTGKIDVGILGRSNSQNIDKLINFLKNKEFTNMRKWVVTNMDNDYKVLFRAIYDKLYDYLQPQSIPEAVLIIGEYQYKAAFVADMEINSVAFLTEIMMRCEFK